VALHPEIDPLVGETLRVVIGRLRAYVGGSAPID
jgi:hypothetical protein